MPEMIDVVPEGTPAGNAHLWGALADGTVRRFRHDAIRDYVLAAAAAASAGQLVVATADAPQSLKDAAAFEDDGSGNGQNAVNQALIAAARPSDVTNGEGWGSVTIAGPNLFVGQNGGSIEMQPGTLLRGAGPATFIRPNNNIGVNNGVIELANQNVAHARVEGLTIGNPNDGVSQATHIKFEQNAQGGAYDINTGNDPYLWVKHCIFLKPGGKGVWISGPSGGARATIMQHNLCRNSGDTSYVVDSSDCQIHFNGAMSPDGAAGFQNAGGSTEWIGNKVFYSAVDGIVSNSSRATFIGNFAQDNGRYGVISTSSEFNWVGGQIDSNARLDTSGCGLRLQSTNINVMGMVVGDRAHSPNQQNTAIQLISTPDGIIIGSTDVPGGGTHVSGGLGTGIGLIARAGTTPWTSGI